jgi:3-methyladenine DNA glycosylase AlkD
VSSCCPHRNTIYLFIFQTLAYEGGYGEGDKFIGVRVPNQRKVAKKYYKTITLDELDSLIQDPVHEFRATALAILVYKFQKSRSESEREQIAAYYLANLDYVNNWDLVDMSADKILGAFLFNKDRSLLYELARSEDLWRQRTAVMATFYFIKQHDFADTLRLAELMINHGHHLIHKAVGWMLREIGSRDLKTEVEFLKKHHLEMPRTMLRYAVEKLDPALKEKFMAK